MAPACNIDQLQHGLGALAMRSAKVEDAMVTLERVAIEQIGQI
jgi:hypothetical protein